MNSRRRLLVGILFNIFISAFVTGTIIFFYDLAHRDDRSNCLPELATGLPGEGSVAVSITSVSGTGVLNDEQVVIRNNGSEALILTGWTLKDSKGITYTFPQLNLYPDGSLQVHTKTGTDRLPDLYWNRSAPLWESGELAVLYDAQNMARAFYRVP
jgi:hypothetical protein